MFQKGVIWTSPFRSLVAMQEQHRDSVLQTALHVLRTRITSMAWVGILICKMFLYHLGHLARNSLYTLLLFHTLYYLVEYQTIWYQASTRAGGCTDTSTKLPAPQRVKALPLSPFRAVCSHHRAAHTPEREQQNKVLRSDYAVKSEREGCPIQEGNVVHSNLSRRKLILRLVQLWCSWDIWYELDMEPVNTLARR